MGYYSGNGETTNGGSTVSVLMSGPYYGGQFCILQRRDSVVTLKNGVSEATAKNEKATANLTSWRFDSTATPIPACKGSRRQATFSQIAGSNLFSLSITDDTLYVRGSRQAVNEQSATWVPANGWSS